MTVVSILACSIRSSGFRIGIVRQIVRGSIADERKPLLAGVQGVEFLAPLQPGRGVRAAREQIRALSARLRDDRQLSGDIEAVAAAIREGAIIEAVEAEVGELR